MNTESKKVLVGEGVKFERIRRITGYLVGTVDRFIIHQPYQYFIITCHIPQYQSSIWTKTSLHTDVYKRQV